MPELYQLIVEESGGIALAKLAGEIDISNADELGGELQARVSNRVLAVIVDVSEVSYIDSYGISQLFDLNRRLRTRQQRLRVVVPEGAHLRRLLELVDFHELAEMDTSVDEARAVLTAPADEGELAQ